MTSSASIWLDPDGSNPLPPDRVIIRDERTLLESMLNGTYDRVVVHGQRLCDCAFQIAFARGIPVERLAAPDDELRTLCPSLTMEEAKALVQRLGQRLWSLQRPLELPAVCEYLSSTGFWSSAPNIENAVHWLIWWGGEQDPIVQKLAETQGKQLLVQSEDPFLRHCYNVADQKKALDLLVVWLGLGDDYGADVCPPFPDVTLPRTALPIIRDRFRRYLLQHGPHGVANALARVPQRQSELKAQIAEEIAQYLLTHPAHITVEWITRLQPFAPNDLETRLRAKMPVPTPPDPPVEPESVRKWYVETYQPWRRWVHENPDQVGDDIARNIGMKFGKWYLQTFPGMLAGGEGMEDIGWVRAHRLRDARPAENTRILLIIADGLGLADCEHLLQAINTRVPRLTVVENDIVFSSLPTVTEFTKRTVLTGNPASDEIVESDSVSGEYAGGAIQRLNDPRPLAVLPWTLTEPDRTYHFAVNNAGDLQSALRKVIDGIAYEVGRVVDEVADEWRLQIILTSDHGRLLTKVPREITIPPGLNGHGRAAWGTAAMPPALVDSVFVEDRVAWINPAAFRLPDHQHYVVILDDSAFTTQTGHKGIERFPHGGVFPEEVLVPWVVLERDIAPPKIEFTLTGTGESKKMGTFHLSVFNNCPYDVQLIALELRWPEQHRVVPLSDTVGRLSTTTISRQVNDWPDVESVRAELIVRSPSGIEHSVRVDTSLEVQKLYQTDDILGDLL